MAFEQAYYTWAEMGPSGRPGFQFVAASPGIDQAVLKQLEPYAQYTLPPGCPPRLSSSEIAQLPVTLAFHLLPGGEAFMLRSKYTGLDAGGRSGNFFTHFLLSRDPSEFTARMMHLLAWEADFWQEADPGGRRQLSTLVDPGAVAPAQAEARIAKACDLLDGLPNLGQFENLVNCFQSGLNPQRRLILAAPDEAVAAMIGCLALVLPNNLLERFTFTTYSHNPASSNALICGTAAGSEFAIAARSQPSRHYLFDFFGKHFPRLPHSTLFARTIARWYREKDISRVLKFKGFVDRINVTADGGQLDHLLALYLMYRSLDLPSAARMPALQFLVERRLFRVPQLLEMALNFLTEQADSSGESTKILQALYQAARGAGDVEPAHLERIRLLVENRNPSTRPLSSLQQTLKGGALKVSSSANKVEATLALLKSLGGSGEGAITSRELDSFFPSVWPERIILPDDALALADQVPKMVLRSNRFIEFTVNGLLHAQDLLASESGGTTSRILQILKDLDGGPLRQSLDDVTRIKLENCLKLTTWMADFSMFKSVHQQLESVREAFALLPPRNYNSRSQVMSKAVHRFLTAQEKDEALPQFLHNLRLIHEPLMWDRLGHALQQLPRHSIIGVDAFKILFKFLNDAHQKNPNNGLLETIYWEYLMSAYQNLDPKIRKKIDEELAHNTRWNEWRRQGGGWLSGLSDWIRRKK